MIVAHGSGSSRHSSRNRHVAATLNECGLATLLLDLPEPHEERDRRNVLDIPLLGERLLAATHWASARCGIPSPAIGYFGASTGAGAALWAASGGGGEVRTVVVRGGRPDLAGPRLPAVTVPVLLIVGGRDPAVLQLNREVGDRSAARASSRSCRRPPIIRGTGHSRSGRGARGGVVYAPPASATRRPRQRADAGSRVIASSAVTATS